MSWLSKLSFNKTSPGLSLAGGEDSANLNFGISDTNGVDFNGQNKKAKTNLHLYISVDNVRVCFLVTDNSQLPHKIVSNQETFLGPIEDMKEGELVRDVFNCVLKLLTAHADVFENVDSVSVSLPADGVFFRNLEVPNVGEADMQKLILAEIKKALPIDFSQVLFAQNDLGEKNTDMKNFFCVIIQKTLFENYKNLFAKFNLNPYFELEVFSLARISEKDEVNRLIVQVNRNDTHLIFLKGQIIQDVKVLEVGENDLHKSIGKDLGLNFVDVECLKQSLRKLEDNVRDGAQVMQQYIKDLDNKIAKSVTMYLLEYEKKQNTEIKEILICGEYVSKKIKNAIQDEFGSGLKVDFVSEKNFGEFVADEFTLDELKRYAQCFGLAKREK